MLFNDLLPKRPRGWTAYKPNSEYVRLAPDVLESRKTGEIIHFLKDPAALRFGASAVSAKKIAIEAVTAQRAQLATALGLAADHSAVALAVLPLAVEALRADGRSLAAQYAIDLIRRSGGNARKVILPHWLFQLDDDGGVYSFVFDDLKFPRLQLKEIENKQLHHVEIRLRPDGQISVAATYRHPLFFSLRKHVAAPKRSATPGEICETHLQRVGITTTCLDLIPGLVGKNISKNMSVALRYRWRWGLIRYVDLDLTMVGEAGKKKKVSFRYDPSRWPDEAEVVRFLNHRFAGAFAFREINKRKKK